MDAQHRQETTDARWNDGTSPDRDGIRLHDVDVSRHQATSSGIGSSSGSSGIGHNWDGSTVDRATKREGLMQRLGSSGMVLVLAFALVLCVAFLNYKDHGLKEQQWPQAIQKSAK